MNAEFARLALARDAVAAGRPPPTLEDERAASERWVRRFAMGRPDLDGVEIRPRGGDLIVEPAGGATSPTRVLYVHGGGLVHYSPALFAPFLALVAARSGAVVEAIDYPKVPDRSAGACVDVLAARVVERREAAPGGALVLVGDSVGGLLGLHLATRVLPGAVSRLVLIYPVLDLHGERGSYQAYGTGHFLDAAAMGRYRTFLAPCFAARRFDPFALAADEIAGLPPCVVVTAGCDILCDEGVAWVDLMRAGGATIDHRHFADLPHDFCLYAGRLASARAAAEAIAAEVAPIEAQTR